LLIPLALSMAIPSMRAETPGLPSEENWQPFDRNKDGRLDEEEFKAFEAANKSKSKGPAMKFPPSRFMFSEDPAANDRISQIIQKFDYDGDMKWNPAELRAYKSYKSGFEFLYDFDANGKIDSKEKRLRDSELDICERLTKDTGKMSNEEQP
jgi:hypothetical protein